MCDLSPGEEGPDASRPGDFESVAQVVAAIADPYAPAYVTAAPRKYSPRQVFDDKPGVGWMIYLPQKITTQLPEARTLIPVKREDGKQIGTIIVSVTDAVFSADNPEHVEVAHRIEICLLTRTCYRPTRIFERAIPSIPCACGLWGQGHFLSAIEEPWFATPGAKRVASNIQLTWRGKRWGNFPAELVAYRATRFWGRLRGDDRKHVSAVPGRSATSCEM
ncbi:Imm52 family immunity protein [Paraburkholderia kururiensis]|uniref:Imm52 family immunity protein n=1 Tax=Paraburkholderia kururiensis TaxID=984307 RepID=UPI003B84B13F